MLTSHVQTIVEVLAGQSVVNRNDKTVQQVPASYNNYHLGQKFHATGDKDQWCVIDYILADAAESSHVFIYSPGSPTAGVTTRMPPASVTEALQLTTS